MKYIGKSPLSITQLLEDYEINKVVFGNRISLQLADHIVSFLTSLQRSDYLTVALLANRDTYVVTFMSSEDMLVELHKQLTSMFSSGVLVIQSATAILWH